MGKIATLIPVFPLIGFLIAALWGKKLSKTLVGIICSTAVLLSFLCSVYVFTIFKLSSDTSVTVNLFDWISAGSLHIPFSFYLDHLSSIFLLVITGIGFLIHVYSTGYMHDDERYHSFFSYLNLFIFFMLLLVMGANYVIMFVGWEGVGLCSYLLIGFWYKNQDYNNAAKKAFIMNRIGDLGFLLGIFLLFMTFGSFGFTDIFTSAKQMSSGNEVITCICLLLFIGATGKSAQLPLYTWLPDAMAGPTPVSALIHAATMVTAGIYMIARSSVLYTLSPTAMEIVAIVGIITALFAATIGLAQNDIKKVLAYSTVSQLGYMFLGLGVGAFTGAVFHVVTHAFFKALLFLGAGSVIHAMSGEQDIRRMGGLKKHLPVTFITFLIGTIAISGIPPFSGFFSKDEILVHAYEHNKIYWVLGVIGSALTAFYMFRLLYLTFFGKFRGTEAQHHHLHESPKSMTIPLVVLAILSAIGGFMGIPEVFHGTHKLNQYLSSSFEGARIWPITLEHSQEYLLMGITLVILLISIFYAYTKYIKKQEVPEEDAAIEGTHKVVYNKYYVDEIYSTLITKPFNWLSGKFYSGLELGFIDSIVNGVGSVSLWKSNWIRKFQTGSIGFYVFAMVIGIATLLLVAML